MTCIAGLKYDKGVIIGGDSAGVGGYDLTVRSDTKVFQNGPFLMGFTSSFRMGQLLHWTFRGDRLEHPEGMSSEAFMSTVFVNAVRQCLKDGGYARKNNEEEIGGTFLVGYRRELFVVESDYQVGIPEDGYAAVGCGAQIALGALFASRVYEDHPEARVLQALEAAERFSAGVRRPSKSKCL